MAFTIAHLDGSMEQQAPLGSIAALLAELDQADGEHTDVAVSHESGWTLSAFADGRLVWENVEGDEEPAHLENVPRDEAVRLGTLVATGDLEQVAAEPWRAGYR